MNDKLRETVQNFLTDYQNRLTELSKLGLNGYEWDDEKDWLGKSIRLLQQCVVDDYKIVPQDQETWNYTRSIIGLDDKGQPIISDSWDNKVTRSINNEKEKGI